MANSSRIVIHKGQELQESAHDGHDFELLHPNQQNGSHVSTIPLQGNVAAPRLFYGARFLNQAMPLVNRETPLVQNEGADGRTADSHWGEMMGISRAKADGVVSKVTKNHIIVKAGDGTEHEHELYDQLPFNRKSVTGSTVIAYRRNGLVRRCKIEDFSWTPGDEASSYDPVTKRSAWKEITDFLVFPCDKRLVRVRFRSGRSVDVTEDHSLVTLGAGANLVPVLPSELVVGVTRCPIVFATQALDSAEWTYEQGALDGLYLSEGCSSYEQAGLVAIAVEPAARKNYVRELVAAVGGGKPHNNKDGKVSWTSAQLKARWHSDFGFYAHGKFIHDRVLHRGRAYLEGLVAGYMSGDGCLNGDCNGTPQLYAVSVSRELRDALILVLQLLGVGTTLYDAPRQHLKSEWRDGYGFRVMNRYLSTLERWFVYDDRQRKLEALRRKYSRSSEYEAITLHADDKETIYAGLSGAERRYMYKSFSEYGYVAKRRLSQLPGAYGDWARSEILWDVVESVVEIPTEEKVYDLSVADSETFALADGLMVHNSGISSKPQVQVGDKVSKGHLLATTDFTDDKGGLALGLNVRVGFAAYKGHSTDDALVISESLAKRMASRHLSTAEQDFDDVVKGGRDHFVSLFPTRFTQEQLKHFDENSIPKKGAVLQPGDPLILATKAKAVNSAAQLGSLSRTMREARSDASHVWDGHVPVTVTDAVKTKNGVSVFYTYDKPVKVGDKLTLRHGQKNVVTKILADHEMPRTADGKPLEMLQNQLGLPSRVNVATPFEALLGKIAAKTGKSMVLPPYLPPGTSTVQYIREKLKEAGMSDKEHVYDPSLGRNLDKPILVGNVYAYRLHHIGSDKLSARGNGAYDANNQPLKGSSDAAGAKRLSALETNGLIAAGAYGFIADSNVRGEKNMDYWRAYKLGHTPPPVGVPFAFHKLRGLMAGMGIRTRDLPGDKIRLAPMTDKDVDKLEPVDITEPHIVDPDSLEGQDGGLFSKELVSQNKWGRIRLPFKIVNPVFEDAIRKAMNLTEKEYAALLRGEHHYKHA